MGAIDESTGVVEYSDTHTTTIRGTPVSNITFIIARDTKGKQELTTTGNIYGIGGTNVEVVLDPHTTKITDDSNKEMMKPIMIPKYGTNQDANKSTRMFVDLKRWGKTLTITISLTNESGNITGTSPTVSNTALGKKKVLMAMQEQGGPIRFYYRNEAFIGFMQKISFDDVETEQIATTAGPSIILTGNINFVMGTDKSVV